MSRFKEGQQVVCIEKFTGFIKCTDWSMVGHFDTYPIVDRVYSVSGIDRTGNIYLCEFSQKYAYAKCKFVPLEDWNKAEEAVEEANVILLHETYYEIEKLESNN